MNSKKLVLVLALMALGLVACGGGAQTVSLNLKGEDIKYDQTALTAKAGDAVTVTFQNSGALEHSFVIDALNVKIEKVQPGQSGTATFSPAAGTYIFYCDIPGHKEAGMTGTLTVNP